MRAFVGVDCDAVSEGVRRAQEPFAGLDGLRLTDPESAHVTLRFLGDVDETLAAHAEHGDDRQSAESDAPGLPALESALADAVAASGVAPFDCTFGGYGTFPEGDYISVVWLGVEEGGEELTRLHEAVEAAAVDLGFDPERHSFTPHVTLARMEHAAEKARVRRVVAERDPQAGPLRVDGVDLVESTLTADGPVYETVERFAL